MGDTWVRSMTHQYTSELTSACQHTSVCISTHQHTLKQTRTYYYTGGRQYVTVHIITMSHALPDGLDRFQAPAIIIQRVSRFAFLRSMGVTVLQKEIIIITTRNATLCKGDRPRSCVESCCDKGGHAVLGQMWSGRKQAAKYK